MFIHRITKQLRARIGSIGLLRIDTARTRFRIAMIEHNMQVLDDMRDQLDEIDLNFVRTRKVDYLDTFEKLDRKSKLNTASQYPLIRHLHQCKEMLAQQEHEIHNDEHRHQLLQSTAMKLQQEIDSIQVDNQRMEKENLLLENRMADVKKVPTITDYAHINHQTRKLRHEIAIWTQRVNIAQVSCCCCCLFF